MLYVINKRYYIKVGRKFILVNITYNNGDIQLKADKSSIIEDNGNVKYTTQIVDEAFKKKFKPEPVMRSYETRKD